MDGLVVLLGTGGTIAGTSTHAGDDRLYLAAQLSAEELLRRVPGVSPPMAVEEVCQMDSRDMDFNVWRQLATRTAFHLARPEVAGVVITHGTDTLEETSYFMHRLLWPAKPVVFAAAMRPADSPEADGPRNLSNAVALARHRGARGVLVTLGSRVFDAPGLHKSHPTDLDAFNAGNRGPLARWESDGRLTCLQEWPQPGSEPIALSVLPEEVSAWPWVEVIMSHAGANGAAVKAMQLAGVDGLVVGSTGNGTIHHALEAALHAARASGVAVRIGSRCGGFDVSTAELRAHGWQTAGPVSLAQARVELLMTLLAGRSGTAD